MGQSHPFLSKSIVCSKVGQTDLRFYHFVMAQTHNNLIGGIFDRLAKVVKCDLRYVWTKIFIIYLSLKKMKQKFSSVLFQTGVNALLKHLFETTVPLVIREHLLYPPLHKFHQACPTLKIPFIHYYPILKYLRLLAASGFIPVKRIFNLSSYQER